MIDLFTSPTPNGWKVSIALESSGCDTTRISSTSCMAGRSNLVPLLPEEDSAGDRSLSGFGRDESIAAPRR
jgi:hypothetical protein